MTEELKETARELAGQLGTSIDKLYEIGITQAYIQFWTAVFIALAFVLIGIGLIVFAKVRRAKWEGLKRDYEGPYSFLGWCSVGIGCFILLFNTLEAVTLIVNPEYRALKIIVGR